MALDYEAGTMDEPGYYLVHSNTMGDHTFSPGVGYRHPQPSGPYDDVRSMAIAERLDDYPSNGYIMFVDNNGHATSVPSLNPDDLVQRDTIPDVTAPADERGWTREYIASFDAGTGIGGDYMVGQGYEALYTRRLDDGTFAVITSRYYVEDLNTFKNLEEGDEGWEPNAYTIREQIEFMHCRDLDDVGGTEISSDYEYGDNYNQPFATYDDVLTWYENECLRCAVQDGRSDFLFMDDKFTASSS